MILKILGHNLVMTLSLVGEGLSMILMMTGDYIVMSHHVDTNNLCENIDDS